MPVYQCIHEGTIIPGGGLERSEEDERCAMTCQTKSVIGEKKVKFAVILEIKSKGTTRSNGPIFSRRLCPIQRYFHQVFARRVVFDMLTRL